MISAKEASDLADQANPIENHLAFLESKILNAAKFGYRSVEIIEDPYPNWGWDTTGKARNQVISRLEDLGYRVDFYADYNEDGYMSVEW